MWVSPPDPDQPPPLERPLRVIEDHESVRPGAWWCRVRGHQMKGWSTVVENVAPGLRRAHLEEAECHCGRMQTSVRAVPRRRRGRSISVLG